MNTSAQPRRSSSLFPGPVDKDDVVVKVGSRADNRSLRKENRGGQISFETRDCQPQESVGYSYPLTFHLQAVGWYYASNPNWCYVSLDMEDRR